MDITTQAAAPFTISRTFDAPRQLVWDAWTDEQHLLKWFGPKGMPMTYAKSDPRPGGTMHYAMSTPDGNELWGKWYYREVRPPEYLEVLATFSDKEGNITRNPWKEDWPLKTLSRTTFSEEGGKTTVTLEWSAFEATPEEQAAFDDPQSRGGMTGGWGGTFDKLEEYLSTAQQ
jgi:uncharacterized protein YndB with AHSA1/START domain